MFHLLLWNQTHIFSLLKGTMVCFSSPLSISLSLLFLSFCVLRHLLYEHTTLKKTTITMTKNGIIFNVEFLFCVFSLFLSQFFEKNIQLKVIRKWKKSGKRENFRNDVTPTNKSSKYIYKQREIVRDREKLQRKKKWKRK